MNEIRNTRLVIKYPESMGCLFYTSAAYMALKCMEILYAELARVLGWT